MQCPSCGFDNLPGADTCENCHASLTQEDVPQALTSIELSLMEDPVATLRPAEPVTVPEQASVREAVDTMRARGIGCLLVTGEDGRLSGILTERDLLQEVAVSGADLDHVRVAEVMSPAPDTHKPHHPLGYALHRMIVSDLRYLSLVDAEERPVGILSSRDIIAYMAERLEADQP